ncbi:MAG: Bacteriophage protein gp37, partial [Gammaproteobacteria bacterium]|nr:Bacteriophage protein gp37 [Gammaproteobacteria bacterium]
CRRADVPFFFKQWGGVQKHRTGRKLFGCIYDEMPVWRQLQMPACCLTKIGYRVASARMLPRNP